MLSNVCVSIEAGKVGNDSCILPHSQLENRSGFGAEPVWHLNLRVSSNAFSTSSPQLQFVGRFQPTTWARALGIVAGIEKWQSGRAAWFPISCLRH